MSDSPPIRRGVVAVIRRADGCLLVIRRSRWVAAPGAYCFPGGALEGGETEELALVRELREELGVEVRPLHRIWECLTPWNVQLAWWAACLIAPDAPLVPALHEVESYAWLPVDEIAQLPELLTTNRDFLRAVQGGIVQLDRLI